MCWPASRSLWSGTKQLQLSPPSQIPAGSLRFSTTLQSEDWRRGELNPCPRRHRRKHLHVYPAINSEEPSHAPAHCRLPSVRDGRSCRRARSLRASASLLSTFSLPAGVAAKTSRSIKPRELDLRSLRLFVLVRFLTRPTNRPRHAACASNDESKPVRPPENCA